MLPTYDLATHCPPTPPPPTLTVNAKGNAYLSKALLAQLGLRGSQPADVLPPSADCPHWQLDLRPTAARRISWYADTRPRIRGLRLPADLFEPGESLTLALGGPLSAGGYLLTPVATTQPDQLD